MFVIFDPETIKAKLQELLINENKKARKDLAYSKHENKKNANENNINEQLAILQLALVYQSKKQMIKSKHTKHGQRNKNKTKTLLTDK